MKCGKRADDASVLFFTVMRFRFKNLEVKLSSLANMHEALEWNVARQDLLFHVYSV